MKKLLAITLTLVMLLGALSTVTLSVNAAELTTTDDGWDGTTATQPEGTGEKDDPWLISSAANLMWMANQAGSSQAGGTQLLLQGYFEQTSDIDLNGKTMRSIGCYINSDFINETGTQTINAFGGNYNGNGYSIKNGYVINKNNDHGANGNWATGLFGVIFGATIENVVLDNIHVSDKTQVGALVGVAQSYSAADKQLNNTIRNCVIKNNCTVTGTDASQGGAWWNGQANLMRIAGIVALGVNVTIENCENGATLIANNTINAPLMGGIAAQIGGGATITNCINKGNMLVKYTGENNFNNKMMVQGGGIVGLISFDSAVAPLTSPATIEGCYNTGEMTFEVPNANSATNPLNVTDNDLNWGGLVGTIGADAGSGTVNITASYNLADYCGREVIQWRGTDVNVSGLVGQIRRATTTMNNCYSVEVDGHYSYGTAGSGWYSTMLYGGNGNVYVDNGCAIKTADEITPYTNAIDELVAQNQVYGRDSVNYIGVQKSLDDGDNRVRIVAGINTTDVQCFGFEATLADGKKADMQGTTVYEKISASGAALEASEYDAAYFVTVVFNPVTVDADTEVATPVSGTVTGRFYVVNNAGVKVYGSEKFELVFENGVLTSPAANTDHNNAQ